MDKMKKIVACAAMAMVVGSVAASGVYDDCVFLFEGGRDGFNGGTPDGLLQKGEFVDELRVGVPTHENNQGTLNGFSTNFLACTDSVNLHAAGLGSQSVPYLKFQPYIWTTSNGAVTNFNYGTLNLPFVGKACPTNTYSAVLRVRRDKASPLGGTEWLVSFGYSKNTDGQGFMFGFTSAGGLTTHGTGNSSPGNVSMASVNGKVQNIPVGQWTDIGVVVSNNVVRYHVSFPGRDTTSSSSDGPGQIFHYQQVFAAINNVSDAHNGMPPNLTMASASIHLGGQESGENKIYSKTGNQIKFFDGSVQRIAFWNRVLTDREIGEALAFPRPSHVFLGGQNGHADEFGQTDKAEATIGPDLIQKDSWANFPASFRAGDKRTIKFNMSADDATLSQLLVIKPLATSPAAAFRISLNGTVLSENEPMEAGEKLKFPIRAFKTRARFLTGTNSLLLERVDAGAPITVDAIWLGGSWYVGKKDNRQKQDFGWHYAYTYMDYLDTYSYGRALNNGSGAKNWSFIACPPKDVSESFPVRYCVRYKVDGCTDPAAHLDLIVDKTSTNNLGNSTAANTDWWIPLAAGEHDMHFQASGTNGVYYFDCHALTFDPPPLGMMILLR